jgi:hypothetical protein
MSFKGFLTGTLSAVLMLGVSAWAAGDEPHGHEHHVQEHHGDVHVHEAHVVHGEKRGWRGCNLPPGQAKRYGCGVPVHAIVPPPPPPPAHVVVVAPPPPHVSAHIVVTTPALPPPPSVSLHVEAGIHP